jgi:hypothetical protein
VAAARSVVVARSPAWDAIDAVGAGKTIGFRCGLRCAVSGGGALDDLLVALSASSAGFARAEGAGVPDLLSGLLDGRLDGLLPRSADRRML